MRTFLLCFLLTSASAPIHSVAQENEQPVESENSELEKVNEDAETGSATQGDTSASSAKDSKVQKDDKLYFSFAGTKWSDVIDWLANSSGLALHINELPPGSFTYSDDRGFTTQEAIDRINLFLLPEDFTLVRSGRLLTVINLTDPKSLKQLDTLARLVTTEELDKLENHDMVKCIFQLENLETEEAIEELSALNLLKAPDVFSKTKQLLITDTAGKLKLAKRILGSFQPSTLDNGTIVKSFKLKHVSAEDVLSVARPHLGLATGEMIGIDVSLSADVLGKSIFVTGIEDKVQLIEGLIKEIDIEEKKIRNQNDLLQTHRVTGGNVEMVYNVLQTMLSGEEIRLSMDKTAQSIVALAPIGTQNIIKETVEKLQASEAEFAVIPLKHVDPYFVIALLEDMLGLDSSGLDSDSSSGGFGFDRWGGGRWRGDWGGFGRNQNNEVEMDPPKIDADPGSKKLFVLGMKSQIEQIKKIVEELDVATNSVNDSSLFRIIPVKGAQAVKAIEAAARFWKGENSIIFYPSPVSQDKQVKERVIADDKNSPPAAEQEKDNQPLGAGRILSKKLNAEKPSIQIQITDRGILLECEDADALSQFEEILRTVLGPTDSTVSAPIVYYLKYATPDAAIRMLAELLDGGEAAKEAESGTLVNGIVSNSSDTFFGSLIMSREGTLTMTFGTITVVADTRLNRLIAQGTTSELEMIEAYLKIIDKDSSITDIEIYGSAHVVELENVDANEVAATLRDAFYGRVMGGNSTSQNRAQPKSQGGQPQPSRDPRQQASNQNRDGKSNNNSGREGGQQRPPSSSRGGTAARNNEPKMTIAVHEPSNSLIITAPEPLFKQAEKLAKLIDQRGVQAIEVIQIKRPLANDLKQILSGEIPAIGTSAGSTNRGSSRSSGNRSRSSSSRSRNSRNDR